MRLSFEKILCALGFVPAAERGGAHLDTSKPHWSLGGCSDFSRLLTGLQRICSDEYVLYFEGDRVDGEIGEFVNANAVEARLPIAYGTMWPRPYRYHVPATAENLATLSSIMERHANHELAIHFHVYLDDEIILEGHDAFDDPLLMSNRLPESTVASFAKEIGASYLEISP